jgi:hypothetical protein
MRILLDPPRPDAHTFEVDHQIQTALAALHHSLIRIRGAGRFGDDCAAIVLERDGDAEIALAALNLAGIGASVMVKQERNIAADIRARVISGRTHPLRSMP